LNGYSNFINAVKRQRNLGLGPTRVRSTQAPYSQFISSHYHPSSSSLTSIHFHVSWLSDFIFYQKPLYKSLHQSFFYSFITILPPESGATLHYSTILGPPTNCSSKPTAQLKTSLNTVSFHRQYASGPHYQPALLCQARP
jgi:hypothetical protein